MKYSQYTKQMNEKLDLYKKMVLEYNEKINLTGITEDSEFTEKHFYDSIIPTSKINFNDKTIMDLGSGAGFPGIPLAILYPNSHFILVDPMIKRCNFLREVISKCDLKNVEVLETRIEELPDKFFDYFDIIVCRAVSKLNILLEIAMPYLKVNGIFVAYKGMKYKEEINESERALRILNSEIYDIQIRNLPISYDSRYNIIIKKMKEIDKKFPREFSQISKRPL
ncbi:MAG: 16S rRNA (guanine(527)-N(7))-methyltransferase RsmG [Bacilli bacterium]